MLPNLFFAAALSGRSTLVLAMAYLFNFAGWPVIKWCMYLLDSHWQEADMRLQSDEDALAAIEEDARAMIERIGLPDDGQKLEMVICLRQIIDLAAYMKSPDRFVRAPSMF